MPVRVQRVEENSTTITEMSEILVPDTLFLLLPLIPALENSVRIYLPSLVAPGCPLSDLY